MVYLLPLFVVGCASPPSTLVPLTGDAESVFDGRIVGEWRVTSAKPKQERRPIISFGTLDDIVATISTETASCYKLTLKRENSVVSFTCTVCTIDDSFYIDLQHPPIHDAAIAGTTLRPHFFAKCAFVDNQIRLTGCDGARFKEILQADRLPFVEVDSAVVFTGTSEQLHDVIRDNSADLFRVGTGDLILTPRRREGSDNDRFNPSGGSGGD
jgi:hypothetical protein